MNINEIIKNRRIELGLTMKDIAKAVGVSEATVSRWESGNIGNMKRNLISDLAKVLQLDPYTLVTGDMKEASAPYDPDARRLIERVRTSDGMRMLFLAAEDCTEEDIKQAVKIIEALKDKN